MVTIYGILFPDGQCYVGSTENLAVRANSHRIWMRLGKHANAAVNRAFADNGGLFAVEVFEQCAAGHRQSREQFWIDKKKAAGKCLNVRSATVPSFASGHRGRLLTPKQAKALHAFRKPMSAENRALAGRTKLAYAMRVVNADTGAVYANYRDAAAACSRAPCTMLDCVSSGRPLRLAGHRWHYEGREPWPIPEQKPRKRPALSGEVRAAKAARIGALRSSPVINLDTGEVFASQTAAAARYGVSNGSIKCAVNGRSKACAGFRWARH